MQVLNFFHKIFTSNFKRLGVPYKLTFALTYRCNSRCRICQIWKKRPAGEITLKEISTFFKRNNYFNWVDLTGGEIFLRNDLTEITASIIKNCQNLTLLHYATNGLLVEKIVEDTRQVINQKPNLLLITISLDGPPKLHNRLRGIEGNWKKAIRTFQELKKFRGKNFDIVFGIFLCPGYKRNYPTTS